MPTAMKLGLMVYVYIGMILSLRNLYSLDRSPSQTALTSRALLPRQLPEPPPSPRTPQRRTYLVLKYNYTKVLMKLYIA